MTDLSTPAGSRIALRLDAGPDSQRTIRASAEPIVLGRAAGPGRIDDATLEAHHAVVDPRRRVVVQLTGRIPARVDGLPVGNGRAIVAGSVIEMGASRIVIQPWAESTAPERTNPPNRDGLLVLGVGVPHDDGAGRDASPVSMVRRGERGHEVAVSTIGLDVGEARRILVVGPPAERLAHTLAARAASLGVHRVTVTSRPAALWSRSRHGPLVIAHDPDPEVDWTGHELPVDGVVISVGSSWRATLSRRAADGSTTVQRFHAAGRADAGPNEVGQRPRCSRTDRPLVAQQVAGAGPELGSDVARVPEAARRQ